MRLVIDPHILENAFYYGSNDHFELTEEMVLLIHTISYVYELTQKTPPPTPRAKIFISYKSENRDWAELIGTELAMAGYRPWFDKRDLRGGDKWMPEIETFINEATMFLPVLSEWAVTADGIHKTELELAREKQRSKATFIIPLKTGNYELPATLAWLNDLHTIDSSGDWFADLQKAVGKEIGHQAEITALAEERERTCLCVDDNSEYSEIIGRYRNALEDISLPEKSKKHPSPIEQFEKWKQILEGFKALRPKPSFAIGPSLKAEIDGYDCREIKDEVFVKVAIGAEGHLVSEGGVSGKCRQNHEMATCPTAQCLCRTKPNRVLCARDVLNRLKDRRRELENWVRAWRIQSA